MMSFLLAAILGKPAIKDTTQSDLFSLHRELESTDMVESSIPRGENSTMAPKQRKVVAVAARLFQELADRLQRLSLDEEGACNLPPLPDDDNDWPDTSPAESARTPGGASPVRFSPHHRTWGSWAEIPSEESAVSTPPVVDYSSSSSHEAKIPLSTLPSARSCSPDLPQWIFGDEPGLIKYMHAVLQPIPGKPLPPIPAAQR
ncbi:uncharacterized protein LOC130291833 [Hyla sarda]|uniref:uncharacterized protein LOC130291833 n=1 Tax=Hyla sarda TaxID=327740 RepID=UPI0024C43FD9|nr:uncharacterized protein LOC130291833 [Hyla sarda]